MAGAVWLRVERLRHRGAPRFTALTHGHVLEFLRLAPAYGGSLVERAPFALLPGLWGGGELAVYRMVALPCLLAGAALGVWLCARMRGMERPPARPTLARAVALGVCVANPLTLRALELGHPEELLGACLCVAAVMLAARDRPLWAGVLLGLAIANKEWAMLAVGPVLLALGRRTANPHPVDAAKVRAGVSVARALVCAASAMAVSAAALAPLALASRGGSRRVRAAPRCRITRSSNRGRSGGSSAGTAGSSTACSALPSRGIASDRRGRTRSATR